MSVLQASLKLWFLIFLASLDDKSAALNTGVKSVFTCGHIRP